MTLFALDSSGKTSSVAILKDNEIISESFLNEGLTHSETLLVQIDRVFVQSKIKPEDIDYYAITIGPGSFTGLRIGISTIKGLAFPYNTRCIPVSTLQALAVSSLAKDTLTIPVIDARRDRVYTAAYEKSNEGMPLSILKESIMTLRELQEYILTIKKQIHFIGDISNRCYEYCKDYIENISKPETEKYILARDIAAIALKKIERNEVVYASELTPVYLQLSQAERERLEREGKEN